MPTNTNITQQICVNEQQGGNEEHQESATKGQHKHQQNVVRGHQQTPIEPNKGPITSINKSQKGGVDEHQQSIARVPMNVRAQQKNTDEH
jgi:hypothetical protein